jgi:hypothetical protein
MLLAICRQISQGPVVGVGIAWGTTRASEDKKRKMIKVTKLATSGPAAAQGVKLDDILIQVDGDDITFKDESFLINGNPYKDVKEVKEMMKGSPKTEIKLKLKSGGIEYEVLLKRSGCKGTSEMASIKGMKGRVPGTLRNFDKIQDWVQVACVSVSVSVMESAVPGRGTMLHIRSTLFFINSYTQLCTPAYQSTHVDRRVRARAVAAALHGYINGFAGPLILDIIQCVCVCVRMCVLVRACMFCVCVVVRS